MGHLSDIEIIIADKDLAPGIFTWFIRNIPVKH